MQQCIESTPQVMEQDRIDETTAESFPASDPPAWSGTHAGMPPRAPAVDPGRELRAELRADLERLSFPQPANASGERATNVLAAIEEITARALLAAGHAVLRRPTDRGPVSNLEVEKRGYARPAPSSIVVCTRYGADAEATGLVMQLAVIRALASERLRRTVRFVALGSEAASQRDAERLRREGAPVHAVVSLARVGLGRRRGRGGVLIVSNLAAASIARTARDAFQSASRVDARAVSLPGWVPGMGSLNANWFSRQGWSAITVSDEPDVSELVASSWPGSWRRERSPGSTGPADIDLFAAHSWAYPVTSSDA